MMKPTTLPMPKCVNLVIVPTTISRKFNHGANKPLVNQTSEMLYIAYDGCHAFDGKKAAETELIIIKTLMLAKTLFLRQSCE